eukprot:117137_1
MSPSLNCNTVTKLAVFKLLTSLIQTYFCQMQQLLLAMLFLNVFKSNAALFLLLYVVLMVSCSIYLIFKNLSISQRIMHCRGFTVPLRVVARFCFKFILFTNRCIYFQNFLNYSCNFRCETYNFMVYLMVYFIFLAQCVMDHQLVNIIIYQMIYFMVYFMLHQLVYFMVSVIVRHLVYFMVYCMLQQLVYVMVRVMVQQLVYFMVNIHIKNIYTCIIWWRLWIYFLLILFFSGFIAVFIYISAFIFMVPAAG